MERARRIALSYRNALNKLDPDGCEALDERAAAVGQGWVRPLEVEFGDLDELLTAEQIGEMITVDPKTVRMWGYRGRIEVWGERRKPKYRLRDVLNHLRSTRGRREGDKA